MRKRSVLLIVSSLFLFGCTAMRTSLVSAPRTPTAEDLKVRYLKVALLSEKAEPDPEFLEAVKKAFTGLRVKVGLDVGAFTYYQVNLDGAKTMSRIFQKLFEFNGRTNVEAFDIGLLYTHKFIAEDAAGIALTMIGSPMFVLSSADPSSGRFAVVRSLSTVEHEISHLFCAMDGWNDEQNHDIVLKNKWRKYNREFGVCRNFEEAYPDTRDPHAPFGDRYPEVVERAKARAKKVVRN